MKNNQSGILSILVAILIFVNLLVLGVFGYWFYQEKMVNKSTTSPSPISSIIPQVEPTSVPSVEPGPLVSLAPSPKTKSDLEQIKEAFAKKYSKSITEVKVTISKNIGTYANGGVQFEGEIGGGWWLAYNDGSQWIIVADGNGSVMCEDIKAYNFPSDMVPECWDEVNDKLIKR